MKAIRNSNTNATRKELWAKLKPKTSFCLIIFFLIIVTYTDSLFTILLFIKTIRNSNTNATRKELQLNLDYVLLLHATPGRLLQLLQLGR
jgi:hypothetical protein